MADRPSLPASQYQELAPPGPLQPFLVCLWAQRVNATREPYVQRILPDGCIDIVYRASMGLRVVGPATRTVFAELRNETIVGARFRPGMARSLLNLPANDILDTEVDLHDAWSTTRVLSERLSEARSDTDTLRLLEGALLARVEQAQEPDHLVLQVLHQLETNRSARVEHIARTIGLSSRQLLRRFEPAVGYGPKTYQRIHRFQRALSIAEAGFSAERSLAWLAGEAGYVDQAHMAREMSQLSGKSPGSLLDQAHSTLILHDPLQSVQQDSTSSPTRV